MQNKLMACLSTQLSYEIMLGMRHRVTVRGDQRKQALVADDSADTKPREYAAWSSLHISTNFEEESRRRSCDVRLSPARQSSDGKESSKPSKPSNPFKLS